MAQSGYTPILIYASGTASNVPLAANLTSGATGAELALNYADGKLYYKNSSGVVTLLASAATVAPVTTFSAGTTGFTPSTATSGAITLAGTLATTNGGTGLTSFTSGGAVYATSTSALTTGTLPVTAGGTGLATLTANYIPYGNGTSAFSSNSGFTFNGTTLVAPAASLSLSALTSSNTSNFQMGGTLGFSDTGIVSNFVGTTNGYLQSAIQNKSNGTAATAEWIAYNDGGTASTNYATMGINSSGYSGTGSINAAGYSFFLSGSTDLVIGTIGSNAIHFTVNSGSTDAMLISSAGLVTIPSSALTNPTVTNYVETLYAPSAGSSFSVSLANGTIQELTLNANGTITLPSSVAGKSYTIIVTYSGAYTLTWAGGGTLKWSGGTTPTPTSVSGKYDIFNFYCDGTNTYGSVFGLNF